MGHLFISDELERHQSSLLNRMYFLVRAASLTNNDNTTSTTPIASEPAEIRTEQSSADLGVFTLIYNLLAASSILCLVLIPSRAEASCAPIW